MRITDGLVSDFKDLGKNHLIALGFAAAGFTVAYSVNKACLWFFAEKDKNVSKEDKQKESLNKLVFAMIAFGVAAQTNSFVRSIASDFHIKSHPLSQRILALYVTAFVLASLRDQKKVCMGIVLSAAIAYIDPRITSDGAACFGSLLEEILDR